MAISIHKDSHMDHGIPREVVHYVLGTLRDRNEFFVETITLPESIEIRHSLSYWHNPGGWAGDMEVKDVPCGLHLNVPESEVHYAERGDRKYTSRLCKRPPRMVREVTVVAGPHPEDPAAGMILFTMYGGPQAPREPGALTLEGEPLEGDALEESKAFWKTAALSQP